MSNKNQMSFLGHLEELRWHIIRSALAVLVFATLAFIFHKFIFDYIILAPSKPIFFTNKYLCEFGIFINTQKLCINNAALSIINIKMAGQFTTHIVVSIVCGFLVAFPYVFWEFWRFVKPALYEKEQKQARGVVFYSSALFAIGVLFGYYMIIPLSVHFLGSYTVSDQVVNQINLGSYISTVTTIALASGIIFELPIVIYFLSKAGLVTPKGLRKYRRHSFVVILILSAIITPPDVFSQLLVSFPLVILYEIGIKISKNVISKDPFYSENENNEKTSNIKKQTVDN